jgi:hypothetical protein
MKSWKNLKIRFKFPTRGRPDKFFETLDKYYDLMVGKDFEFIVSIDEDDQTMKTEEVISKLKSYNNLQFYFCESKGKIHAINAHMDGDDFDIVILVSDDMIPVKKGFDMIIRKDMNENYPDTDGVLWYNDGHKGSNLNTLCILGLKYYKRFNYIYNPEYISLYCDNEFMEVSLKLNKVKYFDITLIEHQHWAWGYGEMDDLYKENEKPIGVDAETFERRRLKNFDIHGVQQED